MAYKLRGCLHASKHRAITTIAKSGALGSTHVYMKFAYEICMQYMNTNTLIILRHVNKLSFTCLHGFAFVSLSGS